MRISDWSSDVCSSDLRATSRGLSLATTAAFSRFASATNCARAPLGGSAAIFAAAESVNSSISRSEEHTSELQSLMRISYAVFCLKKKKSKKTLEHVTNILTTQSSRYQIETYDTSTHTT